MLVVPLGKKYYMYLWYLKAKCWCGEQVFLSAVVKTGPNMGAHQVKESIVGSTACNILASLICIMKENYLINIKFSLLGLLDGLTFIPGVIDNGSRDGFLNAVFIRGTR
jgi:hypothetical protein